MIMELTLNKDAGNGSGRSLPFTFSEENVVNAIRQLYGQSMVSEVNEWLMEFQQSAASWSICISILNKYVIEKERRNGMREAEVGTGDGVYNWTEGEEPTLFFASQTLCTQAQAGFPQQLEASSASATCVFEEIRNGLSNLIYNYRFGPRKVLKQLCIALCSCLMFSHETKENQQLPAIYHLLNTFGQNIGEEGYGVLMELLTILAEELLNKRVAASWKLRVSFMRSCLKCVASLWTAAAKVYEYAELTQQKYEKIPQQSGASIDTLHSASTLMKSAMRCFSAWITAYVSYAKLLEEMDATHDLNEPSMSVEVFNAMKDQPLFILCLKNLSSTDCEMVDICSDTIMYTLALTHSKSEESLVVLRYILKAYEELFSLMLENYEAAGGLSAVDSVRLVALSHPLVEMTKEHFPNMLYHDSVTSGNSLQAICMCVTSLLKHPVLAVKEQALDFWYNMLSHQLTGSTSGKLNAQGEGPENEEAETKKNQCEILRPLFQRFVKILLDAVEFPEDVEQDDFDFAAFHNFRDECSINLTESTIIVGHQYLLELAGSELLSIAGDAQLRQNPASRKWDRLEACLLVLTTVAPRAPAGGDCYIPSALELLPELPYPSSGIRAYLLRSAASRLIFWTTGFIGSKRELFARIFQLVACQFAPFVLDSSSDKDVNGSERRNCEGMIVQTLNALTSSAGFMIVTEGESKDMHIVLNALTALIVTDGISSENKASLITAAGSVLSYLPKGKMQELHRQLVEPLGENLFGAINNKASKRYLHEFLKLYFTALQCVRPITAFPPPVVNSSGVLADSESRHPVLAVLSQQWSMVEEIILRSGSSEIVVEQGFNSISSIFSTCRTHVTQDTLFYSLLDLLGRSYLLHPSIFHLATARTILGMFAYTPVESVLVALVGPLQVFVEYILNRMQQVGEEYVFDQPDLIGMTVDCVNAALMHCMLAQRVVEKSWFLAMLQAVIQLTPNCLHPKVLHTFIICLSRLIAWVSPPPQLYSFLPGYNVSWSHAAVAETKTTVNNLMLTPYGANRMTYLHGIVNAVIKAVINVHSATQSWIGNAAQVLLPLLSHSSLGATTREILRLVILEIHPDLMSVERREAFYLSCATEKQPRSFADMLLRASEETQADYKRSQFRNQR